MSNTGGEARRNKTVCIRTPYQSQTHRNAIRKALETRIPDRNMGIQLPCSEIWVRKLNGPVCVRWFVSLSAVRDLTTPRGPRQDYNPVPGL